MKKELRRTAADVLFDVAGGLFIALGAYNFASAAGFPLTGFTGIALIINHLTKAPIGIVTVLLNIPVAILCYRILGRRYFLNSVKSLIISSLIIDIVAPLIPLYSGDRMLAAICTGVLSGIGYALIYMRSSSTGGSDFIILAIKAKKPYLTIGRISFVIDGVIVVAGTLIVSGSINGLIYGLVISFIISIVIDKIMYGLNEVKTALVVTDSAPAIAGSIDAEVGRGSTFLKAEGSYSEEHKDVLMCACTSKQMYEVRNIVKRIDPAAFMIVLESSEVLGEGFNKLK